jgi:hypothetical protein
MEVKCFADAKYYFGSHFHDVSDNKLTPYASQNDCLKRHVNMTGGSRI